MFFFDRLLFKELLFGLYGYYHSPVTIQPESRERLFRETMFAISWISNVVIPLSCPSVLLYLVENNEMVLFPMQDGGHRAFFAQLFQRHLKRSTLHAYFSKCMANTCHTYPFASQMREGTQVRQRVILSVSRGNHTDAGWTAIHLVKLLYEFHYFFWGDLLNLYTTCSIA